GAGVGFDLADASDATPRPYDVRSQGYQGFSFWLRTRPGTQTPATSFQVLTSQTASYADGAYHAFSFPTPAASSWTKVSVPFTRLMQPPWTAPSERVAFDPTALLTLQWSFNSGAQ